MKYLEYHQKNVQSYFWRARQGGEVDMIEHKNGQLKAFEIKWKSKSKLKLPAAFAKNYQADYSLIHTENLLSFVSGEGKIIMEGEDS